MGMRGGVRWRRYDRGWGEGGCLKEVGGGNAVGCVRVCNDRLLSGCERHPPNTNPSLTYHNVVLTTASAKHPSHPPKELYAQLRRKVRSN